MNRKKILFIYYQNTKPGGIARVLSQLTAELAELNYDIEILFLLEAHQDFYPIHSKVKKHYINAFGDKYSRFGTSIYKKYNKIPKIYTIYSYLYDFGTYRVLNQWINENHQNYDIIVSCWYKISSMLAVNSKVSKQRGPTCHAASASSHTAPRNSACPSVCNECTECVRRR